ncbi:ImmA/IrrE family metallo-endopeptidase [Weissella confusa]|uniref:ImmA/IrrE family metallo-endopeptidase n=1 Tax=Weissella confusa TaxID=1583 RepID=UPI000B35A3C5|nr:ImmA/IrrE family metallo-endopeptidase [Weissella confusa]
MKYKDVFPIEFIELLNEKVAVSADNKIDPDSELSDKYIDVESMLNMLGLTVERSDELGASGRLIGSKVVINSQDVAERQRFTMAHELGHAVQGRDSAFRKTGTTDSYTVEQKRDEVFANKFAAQLLMPKKLVVQYITNFISENNLDQNKLNQNSIDDIKKFLANNLHVSLKSMGYRIENLNLFVRTAD